MTERFLMRMRGVKVPLGCLCVGAFPLEFSSLIAICFANSLCLYTTHMLHCQPQVLIISKTYLLKYYNMVQQFPIEIHNP